MAELLLEILSEEIPARMQGRAAEDLKRMLSAGLEDHRLGGARVTTEVTPRRLVAFAENVPPSQPDVTEERRGPRVGAPEKAIKGFLGSVGLTMSEMEARETRKGTFYFVTMEHRGKPAAEVIPGVIEDIMARFPWPKAMRWGGGDARWVRPVRRILCVLDGVALSETRFGGVIAGDKTEGHSFMAPDAVVVQTAAEYREELSRRYVELSAGKRREIIEQGAEKLAGSESLTVREDPALFSEVAGLVEWPVPLMGRIDEEFMALPDEVLTASMRSHQKYFSLLDVEGKLAPRFVVVANMETSDEGAAIVAGNERVLRARLSDAKFFWQQDLKKTPESRRDRLKTRIFHARLGSDFDRTERLVALTRFLAEEGYIPACPGDQAERAARLSKTDLVSEMVGEFPELQGIMGGYYARHHGEEEAVATALAEHYAPRGPSDVCPGAPVSVALSLADKLDTLAGFWLIGEKPTGSKDPFALRRAALGVIRLVLENGLRLPFKKAVRRAVEGYDAPGLDHDASALVADLFDFVSERLKVHLRDEGVRHDLISAVFSCDSPARDVGDILPLLNRVHALSLFLKTEDGANLLVAYRRATNIVRIEEKKDGTTYGEDPAESLFDQPEEYTLSESLTEVRRSVADALAKEDFEGAMEALARLRGPVDAFFERVTVNSENRDHRENRLKLLSRIGRAMEDVANFSKVEG